MKRTVTRNRSTSGNNRSTGAHQQPDLIERAIARSGLTKDSFVKTITQTAFEGITAWTQADLERLLTAAETYQLNPLNREIFALSQSLEPLQPILIVVGVDGWSKILNAHPQFNGMQFLEASEHLDNVPAWIECTIHRKDRTVPVAVKEYFQEVRGEHMAWLTHPRRMLRHKALTQCARLAFNLSGIYDSDEAQRIQSARSLSSAKRHVFKPSNKDLIKAALSRS
jgi:phage recombination protein Bet